MKKFYLLVGIVLLLAPLVFAVENYKYNPFTEELDNASKWATDGTDVTYSGNVGIGTTNPGAKLDVRNSGAEDILNLYDDTTEVFTVIDGGNVGIGGVAAPDRRLKIKPASDGVSVLSVINSGNTAEAFVAAVDASGNGTIEVHDSSNNLDIVLDAAGLSYINTGSNVGIGKTNPAAALDVQGLVSNDPIFISRTLTGDGALYVAENGYVGIGTTAPLQKLHVENGAISLGYTTDTYDDLIEFYRGGTLLATIDNVGNECRLIAKNGKSIYVTDDNGVGITVIDGGNVGISDTTPEAKLTVVGDVKISSDLTLTGIPQGTTQPAGVGAGQLWVDTDDDNTVKLGT